MDAISLNLPLTTNNTAGGTSEPANVALAEGRDTGDFAQMLIAGLENLQANAPIDAVAQALQGESAPGDTAQALGVDPNAANTDALAALSAALLQTPAAASLNPAIAARAEQHAAELLAAARHAAAVGAGIDTAATPATIAALPANAADQTAQADFVNVLAQQLLDRQASSTREADLLHSAEFAAQGAHVQPLDSRASTPQASALLDVGAPVSSPGFADELSRQVVWMVDKDAQVAQLRINPPELGPVEVRLTVSGEEAVAQFVSPHLEVRNALESAIARLRDTMAEAGIQLGEASVSAESFRDQASSRSGGQDTPRGYRDDDALGAQRASAASPVQHVRRGLVDVFA